MSEHKVKVVWWRSTESFAYEGDKDRQYNLANPHLEAKADWSGYDAAKAPRKPYTCGSCHTTGWVATGADGPHQDGFPGIHGTWVATGPIKSKPKMTEQPSPDKIRKRSPHSDSMTLVAVMRSTDFKQCDNPTGLWWLNRSRLGEILIQLMGMYELHITRSYTRPVTP